VVRRRSGESYLGSAEVGTTLLALSCIITYFDAFSSTSAGRVAVEIVSCTPDVVVHWTLWARERWSQTRYKADPAIGRIDTSNALESILEKRRKKLLWRQDKPDESRF
jgi:hypothetical protein